MSDASHRDRLARVPLLSRRVLSLNTSGFLSLNLSFNVPPFPYTHLRSNPEALGCGCALELITWGALRTKKTQSHIPRDSDGPTTPWAPGRGWGRGVRGTRHRLHCFSVSGDVNGQWKLRTTAS